MNMINSYNEFIITQKLRGNSPETIKYYYYCLMPLIEFVGFDLDTQNLTSQQIKKYIITLGEKDITTNSIKTYTKGIKCFLNWLYTEAYTNFNLSISLATPKAERKTINILTPIEVKKLFSLFDTKNYLELRNYCICALMLDSGLRKSEIVSLKINDLHIVEGYILVNGKGNKQRFVPIGFNSQKYLLKYISQRPLIVQHNFLFLTRDFKPISNGAISRLFRTLKATKIGDDNFTSRIHPHLLRHTFATSYLENGGNIYALQQILGHTSLDMVKKYVHLTTAKNVVNFKNFSPLDNFNKR